MTIKARLRALPHLEESLRDFSQTVAAAKARTERLRGSSSDLAQDPTGLHESLEEQLRAHQEELSVANEELRTQLDELASVTGRVHAERDRYARLFELAPDSYFLTDRFGTIRDANAAASRMLEIDMRFLIGKPLGVLVDAADSRLLREALNRLRSEPLLELELRFKRRNSAAEWHTLKAVSFDDENAVLWFARSSQKEHESREGIAGGDGESRSASDPARIADLERANRDLEEILARERRLRAQLEQEHVAKDRFLAVLSHDLRAPLNAVLGWTQLLRREPLDQNARDRALATIERNAQAQLRLVEELLDISRIAADKVQLERAPVDLKELVIRAAEAVALEARASGVELRTSIGAETLIVAGDRRRLEQVMTNLVTNALKFTPSGGRVTLALDSNGRDARLVVSDTGRGIAPDLLPHLFDPFRQAGDYTTAREGVGLGLYIARQSLQMHGGSIVAESEGPGRGARFTVLLPLASAPAASRPTRGGAAAKGSEERAEDATEEPRPSSRPPGGLDGIHVLLVDDEEDARELMAAILRHRGAVVTMASDVTAAIHAFDASPPDVVVSDIAMPGRGGLDLARELRARPQLAATLVAVSGFAAPDEVDRALAAGFDVHIAKPLDPTQLVDVIREAASARVR